MIDIYGTLGPACADRKILGEMLSLGMTGMRLNLSHMTLPEAAPMIRLLKDAAGDAGVRPQLLIDMQGPELRTGALPEPLGLEEGTTVCLSCTRTPARNLSGGRSPVQKMPQIPVPAEIRFDIFQLRCRSLPEICPRPKQVASVKSITSRELRPTLV